MIKINNNLERIGDFAEGLAKFCLNRQTQALSQELKESLRWHELTDTTLKMMQNLYYWIFLQNKYKIKKEKNADSKN